MWDLALRMGGQVRAVSGMNGYAVLGWDLGAGLRMAEALGCDLLVAAELLPEIEAIACLKANERMRDNG